MTALIAQKIGIPVSDCAVDAACQSRLQTAIEQSGSIREPVRVLPGANQV
jgi:hypothetical protein